MQSNGAELDEDAATHEPVDPVPQLEQRRFPGTDASPSGRNAPSTEDDVFRRFDRIVDDWGLVRLQPLTDGTLSLKMIDEIVISTGTIICIRLQVLGNALREQGTTVLKTRCRAWRKRSKRLL